MRTAQLLGSQRSMSVDSLLPHRTGRTGCSGLRLVEKDVTLRLSGEARRPLLGSELFQDCKMVSPLLVQEVGYHGVGSGGVAWRV